MKVSKAKITSWAAFHGSNLRIGCMRESAAGDTARKDTRIGGKGQVEGRRRKAEGSRQKAESRMHEAKAGSSRQEAVGGKQEAEGRKQEAVRVGGSAERSS